MKPPYSTILTVLTWIAVFSSDGAAQPTWPSSIDELEDVMFLGSGYRSRGFHSFVTPCSASPDGPGRQTAAEWLRAGFHDMATTDIYYANKGIVHGGIDASLAFELNDGEDIGAGFNSTLLVYANFFNSRLPVADLIALGVYASVRACSGPVIPMRGGRIDATAAGPLGVPQPQNGIGQFTNQFARMGFNVTDMIAMTACGHTLGGVHAEDFTNIVAPGTAPNDFQLFDDTLEFDNNIATRYINGPDTDALSIGISTASGRNSDFQVFSADNNATLQAMTVPAVFNSMCISILQRMIETVPPTVTLSAVIEPYEVKPAGLQLTLLSGGTQLTFSGDIRVRTTVRSAAQISSVQLLYTDRNGASVSTPIDTVVAGTASGFDDSFSFYSFSVDLPVTTSISSFTVLITGTDGTTETYDNNGGGFPISDSVIVQTPQSCVNNGDLTVVAAVRSSVTTPVNMTVTEKVPRKAGSPTPSPVPSLVSTTLDMVQGDTIGPYNIYSASYSIASVAGTKYGVASGSFSDTFKDASDLGTTCGSLNVSEPSSTSSSIVSTSSTSVSSSPIVSTSSTPVSSSPIVPISSTPVSSSSLSVTSISTSAIASPTLGIKQTIGAYSFQGCYTEADSTRALTGASFFNYTGMTLEQCATECVGFSYWGVEYGGECYCGNSLNTGSVLATNQGDCSFVCPGNSYEYCGAGNRLEMYLLSSLASSPSSISSTGSSISSMLSDSSIVSTSSSSSTPPTSLTSSPVTSPSTSVLTSSSAAATQTLHIVPSAGLYNYYGCYTEGDGDRALGAAFYPSDTNTIEDCVAACSPYLYAGAEYGRECWCGNSFGAGSAPAPDSDCSMVCTGNQYEYCGAGNRLSVYIMNGTFAGGSAGSIPASSSQISSIPSSPGSSSTATSATAAATQTGATIKPSIGKYAYYGCQTEATNIRALNEASYYNYTSMTLEMCASDCGGYAYWGVEYGGECYCGNSLNAGSTNATESDCSFLCPGDDLEYCGAGNRLSTYYLTE